MTASKNLLLLSNAGSARGYLADAIEPIGSMGMAGKTALFIPYAGISRTWDAYEALVRESLRDTEVDVVSIHRSKDARLALEQADMVMVGGGNTFNLLLECRTRGLLVPLSNRVAGGLPYVGWSAGSLLCCPTIRTTNDMPIVDPQGFDALGLLPFQLNCHYTARTVPGHMGESRNQRLDEFMRKNPAMPVLGLPEGNWVRVHGADCVMGGKHVGYWFRAPGDVEEISPGPLFYSPADI